MPKIASIKLIIILAKAIQYVDGYQRIVQVSEFFNDDYFTIIVMMISLLVVCMEIVLAVPLTMH